MRWASLSCHKNNASSSKILEQKRLVDFVHFAAAVNSLGGYATRASAQRHWQSAHIKNRVCILLKWQCSSPLFCIWCGRNPCTHKFRPFSCWAFGGSFEGHGERWQFIFRPDWHVCYFDKSGCCMLLWAFSARFKRNDQKRLLLRRRRRARSLAFLTCVPGYYVSLNTNTHTSIYLFMLLDGLLLNIIPWVMHCHIFHDQTREAMLVE